MVLVFHGTARLIVIKSRIRSAIEQADRRICLDQDWWAHRMGWTVTRIGFGARRYRDPRFDDLRRRREGGEVGTGVTT